MSNHLLPPREASHQTRHDTGKDNTPVLRTPVDVHSVSLAVLAVLAVIFALNWGQAVVIPVMLGLMISYTLTAPVNLMQKWHIPRAIGAAVLLLAIVGGTGTAVYSLGGEASDMIETLPQAAQKLRISMLQRAGTSESTMEKMKQAAAEIELAANEAGVSDSGAPIGVTRVQIEAPGFKFQDYLWMGTKGAVVLIGQLAMVLFLAYFILVSGDTFRRKMVKIAGPTLHKKRVTLQVLDDITAQIQRYLLVQIFTSILVGVATWLAFLWMGVEHALIWGIAAGVLKTIPYLGPVVVSGSVLLIAFLQFETIGMAMLVSGVAMLITSIAGYLLTPWLIGRASRMTPVVIFTGVLFWGWLWGLWGLLLGIPIIMIVKAICDRVEDLKPIGELLGD